MIYAKINLLVHMINEYNCIKNASKYLNVRINESVQV